MTATSLSPMAAGAAGKKFEDLVESQLLGARLHRKKRRRFAPNVITNQKPDATKFTIPKFYFNNIYQ